MEKEYYLKINLVDTEFNPLEVEKILYKAIEKQLGRSLNAPEDVICTRIEFYEKK